MIFGVGQFRQPSAPLDQHHADLVLRACAEAEPNRHQDFESLLLATQSGRESASA
jgi:hypothetical protein